MREVAEINWWLADVDPDMISISSLVIYITCRFGTGFLSQCNNGEHMCTEDGIAYNRLGRDGLGPFVVYKLPPVLNRSFLSYHISYTWSPTSCLLLKFSIPQMGLCTLLPVVPQSMSHMQLSALESTVHFCCKASCNHS